MWPLGLDGDDKINLAYRLAWIIAALRRELTTGARFSPDEFQSRLDEAETYFRNATSKDLPSDGDICFVDLLLLEFPTEQSQRSNPSTYIYIYTSSLLHAQIFAARRNREHALGY